MFFDINYVSYDSSYKTNPPPEFQNIFKDFFNFEQLLEAKASYKLNGGICFYKNGGICFYKKIDRIQIASSETLINIKKLKAKPTILIEEIYDDRYTDDKKSKCEILLNKNDLAKDYESKISIDKRLICDKDIITIQIADSNQLWISSNSCLNQPSTTKSSSNDYLFKAAPNPESFDKQTKKYLNYNPHIAKKLGLEYLLTPLTQQKITENHQNYSSSFWSEHCVFGYSDPNLKFMG